MLKRKIIDIKPQVRNPQRRSLIFDDGSVFGISEDVFLSQKPKIGSEYDEDNFNQLINAELKTKAYNSALRLLGYRMRSGAEMNLRLLKKGYPQDIIDSTIDKLLDSGYLDDYEFAIAFANDKVKGRKIGPIVLRREFAKHKIEPQLLENILNKIYQEYPISDLIKQLLIKKRVQKGEKLDQKNKKRIQEFLIRKGFSWDNIIAVFTEWEIN